MKQWLAEIARETTSGPKRSRETFYLPTQDDVRREINSADLMFYQFVNIQDRH